MTQAEDRKSLEPQEERHALKGWQQQAASLADALVEKIELWPPDTQKMLREVHRCVHQQKSAEAYTLLSTAWNYGAGGDLPAREKAVAQELQALLKITRTLECARPLPRPLGLETPGMLFCRVVDEPRELRDLLLGALDASLTPEENLHRVILNLRLNLAYWREGPSLSLAQWESRQEALMALLDLCKSWARGLELLNNEDRVTLLRMLRWRLERCENPLALPEGWLFPRRAAVAPGFFEHTLLTVTALERQRAALGGKQWSVATWDALMGVLFEVLRHVVDDPWGATPQEREALSEALQALATQAPPLAQAVQELEVETAGELPPEMLRALLRRAVYDVALPALQGHLWQENASQAI